MAQYHEAQVLKAEAKQKIREAKALLLRILIEYPDAYVTESTDRMHRVSRRLFKLESKL